MTAVNERMMTMMMMMMMMMMTMMMMHSSQPRNSLVSHTRLLHKRRGCATVRLPRLEIHTLQQ